jgi:hypothetical protein
VIYSEAMDLQPGESAQIPIPLPPELVDRIVHGGRLTAEHGPMMETSRDHYERMVELLIDGESVGTVTLAWERVPLPWPQRVWQWLVRRPRSDVPDIRIGI